jgi:D-threo-aldose 1-dehydrogenase
MQTRFAATLVEAGFNVPPVGFGAGTFSQSAEYFGHTATRANAIAVVGEILRSPFRLVDTSRNYGHGLSEQWIGEAFAKIGGVPKDFLFSTKLDRDFETDRFDASRARESFEQSLAALGAERVPILYLHDPEHARSEREAGATDGPIRELMRIKEEGLATVVGLAAGKIELMKRLIVNWDFDVVLTHSRYTLLNRSAEPLIALAKERGIAVINAAVMASGVFAKGLSAKARYVYREPPEHVVAAVRVIEGICAKYNAPIAAVALQFSLRDQRIASTLVGVSKPERVRETMELARMPIPNALWQEIDRLPVHMDDPEEGRKV